MERLTQIWLPGLGYFLWSGVPDRIDDSTLVGTDPKKLDNPDHDEPIYNYHYNPFMKSWHIDKLEDRK